ncbi:MAG: glycosyl hydrolase [Bythopirellula sp.]|nr:glycosyl hydrolase [Bythopirellula sp.]
MIDINEKLRADDLLARLDVFWAASAKCIRSIEKSCPPGSGSPVFTVQGRYTAKGWTEWTQGFQYGSAILQFDATGDEEFLELGRKRTVEVMAPHLTHVGVHDHGFNNVSTYGNLWRLMNEGRIPEDAWQRNFYELALKVTGAVQASRWANTSLAAGGTGYIYSFNGPQSLFVDTIRSCRALALSHQLGHALMGERDGKISLLQRLVEHASNTAGFNIWYGVGRDAYDVRGRTAHESIFNTNNGEYRCPSTQQGYSAFSTWTRGLAWAMVGFAEELEWLVTRSDKELEPMGGRAETEAVFLNAARATCDFYIEQTPVCGVPYWDTGAPGLAKLGDYLARPADPFNDFEPVDSSAAAIGAQGLLRLGNILTARGETASGEKYRQAGLTVASTLLSDLYLSTDEKHEGLVLHSVYHRPNGWDYIPPGRSVPCGEASMWGDYHVRELALMIGREATGQPYYTFFGPTD